MALAEQVQENQEKTSLERKGICTKSLVRDGRKQECFERNCEFHTLYSFWKKTKHISWEENRGRNGVLSGCDKFTTNYGEDVDYWMPPV